MTITSSRVTGSTPDFARRFGKRIVTFKRAVVKRIFAGVINDTPVLTGRLKANWVVSRGQQAPTVSTALRDRWGIVTIAAMKRSVDELIQKPADSVRFSNSIVYAYRIEYHGHSMKAPRGMLRINLLKAKQIMKEEARVLV